MEIISKLFDELLNTFRRLKGEYKLIIIVYCFVSFINVAMLDFIPNLNLLPAIAFTILYNAIVFIAITCISFTLHTINWNETDIEKRIKDYPLFIVKIIISFCGASIYLLTSFIEDQFTSTNSNIPYKEYFFMVKIIKNMGVFLLASIVISIIKILLLAFTNKTKNAVVNK
jgi:hypothetical protein